MTVQEAVLKRKASKVYLQEDDVNLQDISLVTDAGLWAPTAANIQSSMVISITNKEFKTKVANYFDKTNHDQVLTSQALFIFVGTPWINDDHMKNMVITHSISKWGLPSPEMIESSGNGMIQYYNDRPELKPLVDVLGSGVQMGMMMLQATELGYDTNGMLGFNRKGLTNFLREEGLINEFQEVNTAFSMGHRDEDHERNKILTHNRVEKPMLIKEIN